VAKLQEELETMRPLLEEAVQDSIVTMAKIAEDSVWKKYNILC
jgi:dynein heavy chain